MKIRRSIVIAAGLIAVGLTGITAYAYHEGTKAPEAAAVPVMTPDPNLAMPSPAPSSAPTKQDKHAMLGDVVATASAYLGIDAGELKTQLRSGKTLADIANATAGKSRDGLVAALTASADQKIDAQAAEGTLTAQQATAAKAKAASEVGKVADRAFKSH